MITEHRSVIQSIPGGNDRGIVIWLGIFFKSDDMLNYTGGNVAWCTDFLHRLIHYNFLEPLFPANWRQGRINPAGLLLTITNLSESVGRLRLDGSKLVYYPTLTVISPG